MYTCSQQKYQEIMNHNALGIISSCIILGVGGTLSAFYLFSRKNKRQNESTSVSVPLLPDESNSLTLVLPATSTITIYEGEQDEKYIRERVDLIVQNNLWLLGSLVKRGNGLRLEYSETSSKEFFFVAKDPEISERMNYEEMISRTKCFLVKDGNECLKGGKESILFRVTLINITLTKFAIVFSLNHVIGDGHTFYKLYSMLDPNVSIETLIPSRVFSYRKDVESLTKGNDSLQWLLSAGTTLNMISTLLFSFKLLNVKFNRFQVNGLINKKI